MKHLFPLLFLFGFTPVFSQGYFGLSGSANLSFWEWHIRSLDTDIDYQPAVGWRFGALGGIKFAPWIGLRAELATQMKSNKIDDLEFSDMTSSGVYRERYQYWEGSLLVEVFPVKKLRSLYLMGGATTAYLGRARVKGCVTENGERKCLTSVVDLKEGFYRRNMTSFDWGLGYEFTLDAASRLRVEGRMQQGLEDFTTHDNVDASVRSVMLGVAYVHRL